MRIVIQLFFAWEEAGDFASAGRAEGLEDLDLGLARAVLSSTDRTGVE